MLQYITHLIYGTLVDPSSIFQQNGSEGGDPAVLAGTRTWVGNDKAQRKRALFHMAWQGLPAMISEFTLLRSWAWTS